MRVVESWAPVRICDTGGWTDTWFARSGAVFSIAVAPHVHVRIEATAGEGVDLHAPDLGERYDVDPAHPPGRQPLLEAALQLAVVPPDVRLAVVVRAGVAPGAGTGTSAAVVVALLGALDRLTPGVAAPMAIARDAHRVETELLGLQSGVQDQLAAAVGGINLFEVRYPDASVHPVAVSGATVAALEQRLVLVVLDRPHRSSAVHDEVIARIVGDDREPPAFERLRAAARRSARACAAGDLDALGRAMIDNHDAQRALHPGLISAAADAVVEAARRHGASGWKVNGAGGDGGSLTLLAGQGDGAARRLADDVRAVAGDRVIVPIEIDRDGLRVVTRE